MDERLVAVEQAVPAGEQVALEPALAEVLATAPPSRGRRARGRSSVGRTLGHPRPGRSPRTPRRAGSTRSRRARRAGSVRRVARDHVAQELARARASPRVGRAPGLVDLDRVVAEVGQVEVAQQRAAVGVRVRAHAARRPRGASAASSGDERARARRRAPRAGSSAASSSSAPGAPGSRASLRQRHLVRAPRALDRQAVDHLRARSSPSACAARSSASAGASRSSPPSRAARWIARDLVERLVERRRPVAGAPRRDRRPRRRYGSLAVAREQRSELVSGIRASTVGLAIL